MRIEVAQQTHYPERDVSLAHAHLVGEVRAPVSRQHVERRHRTFALLAPERLVAVGAGGDEIDQLVEELGCDRAHQRCPKILEEDGLEPFEERTSLRIIG